MKTAEESLNNWHKGIISIHNISHEPFHDEPIKVIEIEYNQLLKLMEQFRKEGMEEAFEAGEDNDKFNGSHWIRGGTFEEWYNNQRKEA